MNQSLYLFKSVYICLICFQALPLDLPNYLPWPSWWSGLAIRGTQVPSHQLLLSAQDFGLSCHGDSRRCWRQTPRCLSQCRRKKNRTCHIQWVIGSSSVEQSLRHQPKTTEEDISNPRFFNDQVHFLSLFVPTSIVPCRSHVPVTVTESPSESRGHMKNAIRGCLHASTTARLPTVLWRFVLGSSRSQPRRVLTS